MSTALDLIKRSLRILGVLSIGEEPSADEGQDALFALNTMLGGWNTNRLLMLDLDFEEFNLIPGQQDHTIGPGGDFDTAVPVWTKEIFVTDDAGYDRPVEIVDSNFWGNLNSFDLGTNYPSYAYIDQNFPLRTIKFYPTPKKNNKIKIHNLRKLSSLTGLTSNIVAPEGYDRAIIYNLAVEMAPEYGVQLDPIVLDIARKSLGDIKRVNIKPVKAQFDPFLVGRDTWLPITGSADAVNSNPFYFADPAQPQDGDARIRVDQGKMFFEIYDSATETWNEVGAMFE